MPTAILGGVVNALLHDEGLHSHDAFAAWGDADQGRGASTTVAGSGAGPQSRIISGPEGRPLTLTGVTRDSSGNALGSCVVHMFESGMDLEVGQTTSDGSGNYSLPFAYPEYTYYLVAYLAGSPDVAGTTANTLTGA